jgi:hypothetical protein
VDGIGAGRFARHHDLAPGNGAIAQNADALIIERIPFSPEIGYLEDREFFFWKEM